MKTKEAVEVSYDPDYQNLGQLFTSLSNLSSHVVTDNETSGCRDGNYPLDIRKKQVNSLKALLSAIELTHQKIERNSTC